MPEYFYIAMLYDNLCIAGKYNSKETAEKELPTFPKDSKIFSSESSEINDRDVVKKARELMYHKEVEAK